MSNWCEHEKTNEDVHKDERLTFGKRLKFFRVNVLKLKCKPFCEQFGIKLMTLNSWENLGARISKRSMSNLERSFKEMGVVYDYNWLFMGHEKTPTVSQEAFAVLKTNQRYESISSTDFVYHITSFCYEPIWKKNTKFWLEPVDISDLNSPSFTVARDQHENMHIGVTMISSNNVHILNAYKGSFYTIVLNETCEIFLVKKLSM